MNVPKMQARTMTQPMMTNMANEGGGRGAVGLQ